MRHHPHQVAVRELGHPAFQNPRRSGVYDPFTARIEQPGKFRIGLAMHLP